MTFEHTPIFRGIHTPGRIARDGADRPAYLDLRDVALEDAPWVEIVRHLEPGGLLSYPTETVYGLGTVASPAGTDALARLKGRDPTKPFIVLVPHASVVDELAWSPQARDLASIFWPGALTLLLNDPKGRFPPGVRSEAGAVAVRISPDPFVTSLMERWRGPLLSTSANAPGGTPARSGTEARAVADELGAGAELLVVDLGTLPQSLPSTIVDCTGPDPVVIRDGSIPVGRLRCALPGLENRHV